MYKKILCSRVLSHVRGFSQPAGALEEQWHSRWEQCKAGGGEKALHRHVHKNKKLPVREKLRRILDPDTPFLELGRQAGLDLRYGDVACAGSLAAVGVVAGVMTMIMASDATVKGGTVYPITLKKQLRMQEIAGKCQIPCLYIVDSGGAYLPEQAYIFNEGGRAFYNQAVLAANGIPQLSLVCGSCTAGAAYSAVMPSHCIIMKEIGSLYLAGPPLVKAATGEDVTAEELGGADLHCRVSGSTDYYVETYDEAIKTTRDIVHLHSDLFPAPVTWNNKTSETSSLTTSSDVVQIIGSIADEESLVKYKELFGNGMHCYFAKIGGQKVGLVGGSGVIDGKGALKGSNFVQICEQTAIPLVFIQGDIHTDMTRELASLMRSVALASVPKITLITGRSTGHAYLAMNGGGLLPDLTYCWPGASIECNEATSDVTSSTALDSWTASSEMLCDDIILPSETREILRLSLLATSVYRDKEVLKGRNNVLKF